MPQMPKMPKSNSGTESNTHHETMDKRLAEKSKKIDTAYDRVNNRVQQGSTWQSGKTT